MTPFPFSIVLVLSWSGTTYLPLMICLSEFPHKYPDWAKCWDFVLQSLRAKTSVPQLMVAFPSAFVDNLVPDANEFASSLCLAPFCHSIHYLSNFLPLPSWWLLPVWHPGSYTPVRLLTFGKTELQSEILLIFWQFTCLCAVPLQPNSLWFSWSLLPVLTSDFQPSTSTNSYWASAMCQGSGLLGLPGWTDTIACFWGADGLSRTDRFCCTSTAYQVA